MLVVLMRRLDRLLSNLEYNAIVNREPTQLLQKRHREKNEENAFVSQTILDRLTFCYILVCNVVKDGTAVFTSAAY